MSLENIAREYPHFPYFIATGPESYRTHRAFHPAFFGSFDWHSCVELHWVIVRLLKLFPGLDPEASARAMLNELLTPDNLAAETAFFTDPNHRSLERPYGWGWLLTLQHELETWQDPDGQRWAAAVRPLADHLSGMLVAWLPKMTYPQRVGMHANSAFGLSRSFPHALYRSRHGDGALLDAIRVATERWFINDYDYPARYEPSGADFLSAALCEAELMSHLLKPAAFSGWLMRFLPGLMQSEPVSLFTPAIVSDGTDGQIAHLHGLNLSRAWAFLAIAAALPDGDPRADPLTEAAEAHTAASLPLVVGSDYMVEHWLAAYATLLLS
jgi:hypothetical protein